MASSSESASSVSRQLVEIEEEIKTIDGQLSELKQRKRKLNEKRDQLKRIADKRAGEILNGGDSQWDSESFPWSNALRNGLKTKFRLNDFRELQLSVINACLSGEDAILIMSTGGGKSLCYQLPAVISDGITLVVSPLVSLMEDQVMALQNLGIESVMLDQSCKNDRLNAVQKAMLDRANRTLKMIYVTPEKLAKSKRFMSKLEQCYEVGRLKLIAVDEVHCCSQWGNDFRPDYKFLNILKRQFPTVPLLGLTATASSRIVDDVKDMLSIPAALIFRATFNRQNLFYEVRNKPTENAAFLGDICKLLKERFVGQSGIIYCFSKKESEELTKGLRDAGIKAAFYHADVAPERRSEVHRKWISNHYQVIIATVAFGMGIDKPDVRFVIHHSIPKSMENYYQESGRAGRDNQPAVCLLYFRYGDVFRQSTSVCREKTGQENLYAMVSYCAASSNNCRRSIIARLFGETWDRSWCNRMCDNCEKNTENVEDCVDIADYYRTIIGILAQPGVKLTGLKLLDAVLQQKKGVSKGNAERIIINLLLENYLKEDFHFTPYTIISYLKPGSRSAFFKDGDVIFMAMSDNGHEKSMNGGPPSKKSKQN